MNFISVKEATSIILNNTEIFGVETIPLTNTLSRVLKESVFADRDFPPFDRVSMDGIAISKASFDKGIRSFKIEDIQAAGKAQINLNNPDYCIEAMTGAILPLNTDAVIPYEQINIENGIAKVLIDEISYFKNIHPKGFDKKENELLISENTIIGAAEIGVLATVGKTHVKVAKQPRIAIIATGDELVNVNQTPKPFQIRKSNVYSVLALLNELNLDADLFHLNDDKAVLLKEIDQILKDFDILIFSGGVSKGKFDFLPQVLEELEVKKCFHSVKQKPGKPFWFGKKGSKTIFAFPGNPVATFLNFIKYFKPWYLKSVGLDFESNNLAILEEDFTFKSDLTYYLQVIITNKDGMLFATPIMGNGSADLVNLVEADGFLELTAEKSEFKKGSSLPYLPYR
ncbi:MAG: molybdopterin molybdotransferase MoeA [Flavobacteriaceae bacterium]|nr:molybdopterin molybdotransferase MoeA [Flavobacteriaceae bacterium]